MEGAIDQCVKQWKGAITQEGKQWKGAITQEGKQWKGAITQEGKQWRKPGAALVQARFPSAAGLFFYLPESAAISPGWCSLPAVPFYSRASASVRMLNVTNSGTVPLFGHVGVLHTLMSVGSAAVALPT